MFDHNMIQVHPFEDAPLDRDIYLMDEKWMVGYEAELLNTIGGSGSRTSSFGYIAYAAARAIGHDSIELSWYPNIHDRFHEVRITLPRPAFITCTECCQYDEKPRIFVRGEWLTSLHLRTYSVFALIDAANVKKAIASGALTRPKLIALRDRIDAIAADNPTVAFFSWADSLLLKSNWSVGQYDSPVKYTYEPEKILRMLPAIHEAYIKCLGLDIYAVITQGSNEYYDDELLHISSTRNHISFNSLGLPFAQTQAIEHAARAAIKDKIHLPASVYMDDGFYHSLRFKPGFEKNKESKFKYRAPMATGPSYYFPASFELLADNLETPKTPVP